jgi:probable H4MPT-linked C1 transfer pathway protein
MSRPSAIVGWDIGGVNTKAVHLEIAKGTPTLRSISRPYEVQHRPAALTQTLLELARELGAGVADPHAVTMTAELSQAFRTKREGVAAVLDALETGFPGASLHVYTVDGRFVRPAQARAAPLTVGAANWAATAHLVARSIPTCILIDIGTTSTDLIPIVHGKVVAQGSTDPERLLSGELVYTGALRTPVEAVAPGVPLWGGRAAVSAEAFALMGDVHVWLGRLRSEDYTCRTPDGRPPTREFAGERLARVVCADREMLDEPDIDALAVALAQAQVAMVIEGIGRIRQRWPGITSAVVAGLGDFIAAEAACAAGLAVVPLTSRLGPAARTAPAAAVAWLLWRTLDPEG